MWIEQKPEKKYMNGNSVEVLLEALLFAGKNIHILYQKDVLLLLDSSVPNVLIVLYVIYNYLFIRNIIC